MSAIKNYYENLAYRVLDFVDSYEIMDYHGDCEDAFDATFSLLINEPEVIADFLVNEIAEQALLPGDADDYYRELLQCYEDVTTIIYERRSH